MLRAEAVSFRYDAHLVLHEVSMRVPSGSLLGVLGPNGSGKTTLIHAISGLLEPDQGSIIIDDNTILAILNHGVFNRLRFTTRTSLRTPSTS